MKLLSVLLLALAFAASAEEKPTYKVSESREVHALGLKRTPVSKAFIMKADRMASPARGIAISVPGKVDLSLLVSPPENQGGCGSCWDFSLTKALRSELMLAGEDPGTLSFNYLLNNCGPGPQQGGCNGGDFDAGQSFLSNSGPWLESQDPYTQRESRCKTGLSVAGTALKMTFVGSGNSAPTFLELASAVSAKHMLSIDVAVAGSWGSYAGGIYNGNGSGINHMINMVGYDCETSVDAAGNCVFNAQGQPANGDGFLKVMNNWGTSWGEAGYMRTRWGRNQIAETAAYFEVVQPIPPTPVPPVPPAPTPGGQIPWWILVLGGAVVMLILVVLTQLVLKKSQVKVS